MDKDQRDFVFENRELKKSQEEADGTGPSNDDTDDRGVEQLDVKKQDTSQSN